MTKPTEEESWRFWKPIISNHDGTINATQVSKELYDFYCVMRSVASVYDHITGGKLSKINYPANVVIDAADRYYEDRYEESLEEAAEEAFDAGRSGQYDTYKGWKEKI